MKLKKLVALMSITGAFFLETAYAKESPYLRFPTVRGDTLVFTAEGDLWKSSVQGGIAQRLTSHAGLETNAVISPDGNWVAFNAQYEGIVETYVMPLGGGQPKRISFENSTTKVLGWSAKGEVLITAQAPIGPNKRLLIFSIDPTSLKKKTYPLADANEAALDDTGRYLYFTRFGVHMTNDNVRNYRGGGVAQLWRYDTQSEKEAEQLFKSENYNIKSPMWWNGQLYVLSDRTGSMNLFHANLAQSKLTALTSNTDWEVRNPSMGDGKIAYQVGADVFVYDITAQKSKKVSVDLISDFDQQRKHFIRNALDYETNSDLANKSERVAFTVRGKILTTGLNNVRQVEIPLPDSASARNAVFSHDDKSIFAITDITGENEIWRFPANGLGKPQQLTKNGVTHRIDLYPSPDGKWLAHTDKLGRLWLLDLATLEQSIIDDAGKLGMGIHDSVTWSSDSATLAIVRSNNHLGREQIGLYSIAKKQISFVTGDRYSSFSPCFSPDGKWLYFVSNRHFDVTKKSPWGDRDMGPFFEKRGEIYALALQAGNRFPFSPDEEVIAPVKVAEGAPAESKEADKKLETNPEPDSKKTSKPTLPSIQFEGLAERIYRVPLRASNARSLQVDDKRLYVHDVDYDGESNLKTLAIAKTSPQPEIFAPGVQSFSLSGDKKRVYIRTKMGQFLFDAAAKAPADLSKSRLQTQDLSIYMSPREEWQQLFFDAWRMHRDHLFDKNMRGVDWVKVKEKYAPLVNRVTDRSELDDILRMMAAEVSTLHSQTAMGDVRKAASEGVPASLGAVFERVESGYQIKHFYSSAPELPDQAGPLKAAGKDFRVGDIITHINGIETRKARNIQDLLMNTADKPVLITAQRGQHIFTSQVQAISLEKHEHLRYSDWEVSNADKVNKSSNGRIGYLHLRKMGASDINDFVREFYSQFDREGLIIDVRRNSGGNIDSWIIEKLLRKAWAFWATDVRAPYTNMQQTFRGHLVVLIDQVTYSDGETFAAGVKALKLAPLVGKRTAGAGVWLTDSNRLRDKGMMRAAEFGQFDVKTGKMIVEGVGVEPDIEVENLPKASFHGEDAQLDTAIKLLQKKLQEQPIPKLTRQPLPPVR